MKLPLGYALMRNQAPVGDKFLGWWSSIVCISEARCLFSIQESGRELIVGSLMPVDSDCVNTVFENFTLVSGEIRVYDKIGMIAQYMMNHSDIGLIYRLTTKVNNGVKVGMDMGINGLPSILTYLNAHHLVADSYLTIANGNNKNL